MADVQNPPARLTREDIEAMLRLMEAAAQRPEPNPEKDREALRDWFAGQALAVIGGMYANDQAEFNGVRDAAETAWLLADEMMAVRALASGQSK